MTNQQRVNFDHRKLEMDASGLQREKKATVLRPGLFLVQNVFACIMYRLYVKHL